MKNVVQNQKFGSKIINFAQKSKILVQKSKIWFKIKNLVQNQKFGSKSKFWFKIKKIIEKSKKKLVKNQNFVQKFFCQKS